MLSVQQGLKDEGVSVPMTKLCQWFGVARRTTYYKPTRSPAKVNPELAEPIKEMIEAEPSFGYRTVAALLGMNKNTVQRIFQLKGWQVRKRALGQRPRIAAKVSRAEKPDQRWATDLCRVWGGKDGWLSLALVIDCSTRQLLGWHLSRTGKASTASAALEQALITADIALVKREDGIDVDSADTAMLGGAIELKNVSFRYSDHDPWILHGINMKIEPGEMIAVVGASGGGKSTLLKIMAGLYPPTNGEVLFDGIPVRSLGINRVRKSLCLVMQDDELLAGSIAQNVAFFDEGFDSERMWSALRSAKLDQHVLSFPMQENTLIGDLGSSLSGGQRQRLMIARAIYKDPSIIMFDEPTSNIDVQNEREIHANLISMQITRVMVTHRPDAARLADRVYIVRAGKVAELKKAPTSAVAEDV